MTKLDERGVFFTEKCVKGAQRAKIALVRTPDLFPVLKYLHSNPKDNAYKEACRKVISESDGEIVIFPSPPKNP